MNIIQESLQKFLTADTLASLTPSEYLEVKGNVETIVQNTITQYLATELSQDELAIQQVNLEDGNGEYILHFFDQHPAHKIALYSRIEDTLSNIL